MLCAYVSPRQGAQVFAFAIFSVDFFLIPCVQVSSNIVVLFMIFQLIPFRLGQIWLVSLHYVNMISIFFSLPLLLLLLCTIDVSLRIAYTMYLPISNFDTITHSVIIRFYCFIRSQYCLRPADWNVADSNSHSKNHHPF